MTTERGEKRPQDGSIVFKIALSTETKDQPEHPTSCSKPDKLSRFLEHQLTTYLVVESLYENLCHVRNKWEGQAMSS